MFTSSAFLRRSRLGRRAALTAAGARVFAAAFAAALALGLPPAAAQPAPKFKVVTTFTVIADMARNVAGNTAQVESITKPGAEIHEYQPTPSDLAHTQSAQLVL